MNDKKGLIYYRDKSGNLRVFDPNKIKIKNRNLAKRKEDNSTDESGDASTRKKTLLKLKQEREKVLDIKKRLEENKDAEFENMKERHDSAINRLNGSSYGSGTYDVDTLKLVEYGDGYQVTFCQIGDNYDSNTYYNLCKEFLKYSSDNRVCAGKFEGTPEISFNVKDKNVAIYLAQKSIWDWANADEIKTGGNGRRLGR